MFPKLGKALGVGSSSPGQPRTQSGGVPLSVIGADVRIVGDIITQGEMQIDGQVDGDITCQRLLVGEGGRISGEVTAETVQVHGELHGKVNAQRVVIARSARVVGDITHESLEIEAGAAMEGHCHRRSGAPKVEAKAAEMAARKSNGATAPSSAPAQPEAVGSA
jgi:cytoskeletal protein CcmA (bactofilin family)